MYSLRQATQYITLHAPLNQEWDSHSEANGRLVVIFYITWGGVKHTVQHALHILLVRLCAVHAHVLLGWHYNAFSKGLHAPLINALLALLLYNNHM
jgi:hypothetical protein